MSYDIREDWGIISDPTDETKKRVVLYSIYDLQEYNDSVENGEDYDGEELHWASKEMEPEVAEDLVDFLRQYRKSFIESLSKAYSKKP